jgi:hypothetical protein
MSCVYVDRVQSCEGCVRRWSCQEKLSYHVAAGIALCVAGVTDASAELRGSVERQRWAVLCMYGCACEAVSPWEVLSQHLSCSQRMLLWLRLSQQSFAM